MKILIYGINFSPEMTGIGKYTGEMASWLVKQGHDVRVVTAPPYYPSWSLAEGFRNGWVREEWHGVQIWRCPLWIPKNPNGLNRIFHLISFAVTSFPIMIRHAGWRPSLVWVVEPTFFCAPAALLVSRLINAKSWLHVQDFEIDAAFEMGIIKTFKFRRLINHIEFLIKNKFNVVSTISNSMCSGLILKGINSSKIEIVPNWVDISAIRPRSIEMGDNPYRDELGFEKNSVIALYSGNMGKKQGLELLAKAARLCHADFFKSDLKIEFLFCGNGSGREDFEIESAGLTNVKFIDLQPINRLNELLSLADIHLLPQRADAADLVMPSKLTGMLASGKPIIATALPDTEIAHVINGHQSQKNANSSTYESCGIVVMPDEPVALARAIQYLAINPEIRDKMGSNARKYAEKFLHTDAVLNRWLDRVEREIR